LARTAEPTDGRKHPLTKKSALAMCLLAVLALGMSACSSKSKTDTTTTTTAAGATTTAAATGPVTKGDKASFFLEASPQTSDGKTIKIDQAIFTGTKGWVGIHADAGGAPGPVIGVSKLLDAGTSSNITVTLDKPLTATAKVFPMLHLEDNNNTTYDFPNGDAPAKVGADVVVLPITITVK